VTILNVRNEQLFPIFAFSLRRQSTHQRTCCREVKKGQAPSCTCICTAIGPMRGAETRQDNADQAKCSRNTTLVYTASSVSFDLPRRSKETLLAGYRNTTSIQKRAHHTRTPVAATFPLFMSSQHSPSVGRHRKERLLYQTFEVAGPKTLET